MAHGQVPHEEMPHEQQLQAAQHLPADLMLVKMEGEHIMTMAAARRRPLVEVIKEAQDLLTANPAAAEAAVYSKPCGLKPDKCKKCGHQVQRKGWQKFNPRCEKCGGKNTNLIEGKQQYARGLSIKAATSLANLVGYNRVASSAAPVEDGVWRVTSIFVDYARGIIRSKERMVSQWRRKYQSTQLEKQDDERFLETTLLGAQSKNERNAMLSGMPYELTQAYEQTAREVAPKFLDAAKVQTIIDSFAEQGITLVDLQHLVGRTKTEGWRKEEYENLRGVWVALDNGEMTVEELLNQCRPRAGEDGHGAEDAGQADGQDAAGADQGEEAGKKAGTRKRGATSTADQVASELTGQAPASADALEVEQPAEDPAPPEPAVPAKASRKSAPAAAPAENPSDATDHNPSSAGTRPATGGRSGAATAGPQAPAAQPPAAPQPPAKQKMTEEGCKQYIRARYEDEAGAFDLDAIAKRAIGQANPLNYMDQILTRNNPHWSNFVAKEGEGEQQQGLLPAEGEEGEGEEAGSGEADDDRPESVTSPLARPGVLGGAATAFEKKIIAAKSAAAIKTSLGKADANEELGTEELAYLRDLADRRAWYYEHGQEPPAEG